MTKRAPGWLFYFVVALMVVVLGAFAVLLAKSQSDARDDIDQNFSDRAGIAAALTESLFAATSSAGSQPEENAEIYGGQVSQKTMDKQAKAGNSAFLALIGSDGQVLAVSSTVSPELESLLGSDPPWIADVLGRAPYGLSDVLDVAGDERAVGLATPVGTTSGLRVLASGIDPGLLTAFLGGYLAEVPSVDDGSAYILDENGNVIGAGSPGSTASGSRPLRSPTARGRS